MDKAALVDQNIDAGRRLREKLDGANFPAFATLWLYSADLDEWRFLIASPIVDDKGPSAAYKKLQALFRKSEAGHISPAISLRNTKIVSPASEITLLLGKAINTGSGITNIRFSGNTVNGVFFEDALIYRINSKLIRDYAKKHISGNAHSRAAPSG